MLRTIACTVGVLAGLTGGGALAQGPDVTGEHFDCVIEPKSTIELGSPEEGIISEIAVERGDSVAAGDIVARLDSELQRLTVELARIRAGSDVEVRQNRARLSFRERETARVEKLYERDVVSTKTREEAAIESDLARYGVESAELQLKLAQVELAQARARLDRRRILSPVDGVVVAVDMAPGEYAYEQSPVMTIAEIDPLYVEVYVPIAHYGQVHAGMPAEVRPQAPIGGTHRARVKVVDRVFDAASGTFGVRLEVPNRDFRLPAGLKCRVRFMPRAAAETDGDVDNELDLLAPSPAGLSEAQSDPAN